MKKLLFTFLLSLSFVLVLGMGRVEAAEIDLLAGKDIPVGHVDVWNDYDNIYVNYVTDEGWCLMETNLHIADEDGFPVNKAGNPQVGHFDYQGTHECVSEFLYTIITEDFTPGQIYQMAAHAKVRSVSSDIIVETIFSDRNTLYLDDLAEWVPSIPVEDPLHLQWQAKMLEWGMTEYEWLWDGIYTNPTTSKTLNFLREIEIDGMPISAELRATADNSIATFVNGTPLFSNGTWNVLTTKSVDFEEGLNKLRFDVTNAAGGDWVGNPGGLIYDLNYSYHPFIYESAWADGTGFVTKGNWATFFEYPISDCDQINLDNSIATATDNKDGTLTLEVNVENICRQRVENLNPTKDFYVKDSEILGQFYFGTGNIPGSDFEKWEINEGKYSILLERNYFNSRPLGYNDGWHRIWDIYVNGKMIQDDLHLYTTYSMLGDWDVDITLGANTYPRYIEITSQTPSSDVDGFYGNTYDSTVPSYGPVSGSITGRQVHMYYERTDIITDYTANFHGEISLDGLSISGTWSDNKGQTGTFYMFK